MWHPTLTAPKKQPRRFSSPRPCAFYLVSRLHKLSGCTNAKPVGTALCVQPLDTVIQVGHWITSLSQTLPSGFAGTTFDALRPASSPSCRRMRLIARRAPVTEHSGRRGLMIRQRTTGFPDPSSTPIPDTRDYRFSPIPVKRKNPPSQSFAQILPSVPPPSIVARTHQPSDGRLPRRACSSRYA